MAIATTTSLGEVKLAGDIAGSTNALAPELTLQPGLVAGQYSIPIVTVNTKGLITAIQNGALASYLPTATTTGKGVVQIGEGLAVDGAGVLSANIPIASSTIRGSVKIGSGLTVTAAGAVSIPDATPTTKGVVTLAATSNMTITNGALSVPQAGSTTPGVFKVGAGLTMNGDVLSANLATASTLGVVKVGAGLTVSSGLISTSFPDATASTKGVVQIGTGITVTAGTISVSGGAAVATTTTKGVVQVGNGLAVDGAGLLSTNIPDATNSTRGYIMAGQNVSIAGGVLSVVVPVATTTSQGTVQPGSGVSINAGVISTTTTVPDATTTTKGVVQIGNGLSVASGVVAAALATPSVAGAVIVGGGLSVDAYGTLTSTLPVASTASRGAVKVGTGLTVDGAGLLQANTSLVALVDRPNQFVGTQSVTPVTLPSTATVTPDGLASNNFILNLTQNTTLNSFTNAVPGATYKFFVKQDGVGGRTLTKSSAYYTPDNGSTAIGLIANQITLLEVVVSGAGFFLTKATIYTV